MSTMYMVILGILLLLAVYDLVVGITNDAANFLNSARGCNVARHSFIVGVAAVGVVLGASFSGGMMEIARSGVFVPAAFSFHDLMLLFLAVMLTDVILLDLFNTFGMPTSTTVSLVFELLGAALAGALFTMYHGGADAAQELGAYINSSKALTIISGIFISVGISFVCGCIIMWLARLLFSFQYRKMYKYVGAVWCALSLTAITYFAVFKGLKSSTLVDKATLMWLNDNILLATLVALAGWYVISALLQYVLRINTLKITVLAGTCALAFAFAGNDLVNFIGVFMAAEESMHIATDYVAAGGDLSTLKMGALAAPVKANVFYLIGAGLIMVLALVFSKKARTVSDTEVKLARSKAGGKERFGSCAPARVLVRYTLNAVRAVNAITPAPIARFVGKRFKPLEIAEDETQAFDLIRASVNLTVSALLISLATSLKLPLSTTYVTFMVAMGSSLADRAWGRDSAVYRITGVLTVIGGWLMTGLLACTAAFITASVMLYLGMWGVGIMLAIAAFVLVKAAILHKRKGKDNTVILNLDDRNTLLNIGEASADRMGRILGIYRATVKALLNENRDDLKRLRRKAREISRTLKAMKEDEILPSLHGLNPRLAHRGQLLLRVHESGMAVAENLLSIVKAGYKHIDNNHTGLSPEQAQDLLSMCNKVAAFYPGMCQMLKSSDFSNMEAMMQQAGDLSSDFADCIARHLIRENEDEGCFRTAILYLNLLNETRSMMRKSFSLIQEQRELFEAP
ncbi:MAG: inorganic phosphate transporter [Akkermansia sp.]|nr:inorganic phosphate transporter [Akkermansia sp.]